MQNQEKGKQTAPSRPIRFRAWNNKDKTMYQLPFGAFTLESALAIETNKVMQFTGLHDKNGKEIYEGDMVKARLMTGDNHTYNYEVGFKDGAFTVNGYPMMTYDAVEVIGNIYENPELLK